MLKLVEASKKKKKKKKKKKRNNRCYGKWKKGGCKRKRLESDSYQGALVRICEVGKRVIGHYILVLLWWNVEFVDNMCGGDVITCLL